MRLIKMLGLAAVAALASMAFIGASSASATSTALCTVDTSLVCAAGSLISGHVEGIATKPLLKSSLGNVECATSTILGNIAIPLANPLKGANELVDFTTCKELTFGTSCTVTTESNGELLLLKTAPNLGEVKVDNVKVRLNCASLGLNCAYTKPATALHAVGATLPLVNGGTTSLGKVTATEVSLENTGGGFCPATSKWTATYFIQLPHEFFITE
jgi:hypothetical protein